MTIDEAVETFVRGFCYGKSRTYPYVPSLVDGLWIMRDFPSRTKDRVIEVVACNHSPDEVVSRLRRMGIGWHFLAVIRADETDYDQVRREYKDHGYRATSTEWLFVHDLVDIPVFESDPAVILVPDEDAWKTVPQRASQPRKLVPGTRLFCVHDGLVDFGWVESVPSGQNAWVAGLHVHADVRRRGYGRALMSRLLQVDKAHGVSHSVLLASTAGAKLYPLLGYRQIGVLQMFCPAQRTEPSG